MYIRDIRRDDRDCIPNTLCWCCWADNESWGFQERKKFWYYQKNGPGSSVDIATDYGLEGPGSNPGGARFSARPDRPWGPPSLLYKGYRVFPGGKLRPGRAADHSPPSSAAVMEEWSYTSTNPLGHTGPVTGKLYFYYQKNYK